MNKNLLTASDEPKGRIIIVVKMDLERVNSFVRVVKAFPCDKKKEAIMILESIRDCFYTSERLCQWKEENGKDIFSEGNFVSDELSEIINQIKA